MFVNERVRNSLEDNHRQWSETLSHTLAEATVNNLIEIQSHQVRETLRRTTRSDPRVAYIIITDFQGEVFAHTFDEALPDSLIVDEKLVTDESGILVKEVDFRGMKITETSHSLIEGLNAQIRIGIDRAKLGETIKVATKGILLVGAIILLLGLTISIVLARNITRPVRSLSIAMQSYAAGDQIQLPEFTKLDSDTQKLVNSFEEMIRQRSQIESELLESESNLQSIIQNSPVAIVIVNKNNDIISCNNKFTNDYGYLQSDISTAEMWWDAAYPDLTYREKVQSEWLAAVEESTRTGKEIPPQTWTLTCKDGTKRTAIFSMVWLKEVGVITIVDITDRMQAEQALKRSSQLAAAGQMASGIAHEINNPLATISACVEVVERNTDAIVMDSPHGQQLHDYIKLIGEESTRAAGIITDMLDFTRDKPLTVTKFKLCDVVKKTVYLFEVQSSNENYDFQLSFAEILPNIEGDSSRIRQVLIVLLTNAMESMPGGGVISVSCEWDKKEEFVTLQVSDEGIGIPEEKQKEIFEPFYTSKIEGSGTGLGLSIAQDIVEKHNGVMEVQSTLGEGSTFSVKFPCVSQ